MSSEEGLSTLTPNSCAFESELFRLKSVDSPRVYHIHSDLLAQKGGALKEVCFKESRFKESKERLYTFEDTSAGTVARFVEWAHSHDYSAKLQVEYSKDDFSDQSESNQEEDKSSNLGTVAKAARKAVLLDNHPLLSHARMYVFGNTYMIEELKETSFQKLTEQLKSFDNSQGVDLNVAVISLLNCCFSNLHPDDDLLDYLGQYVAYRLTTFRVLPEFLNILPKVGHAIVPYVGACGKAPWSQRLCDPSKKLPHYTGA